MSYPTPNPTIDTEDGIGLQYDTDAFTLEPEPEQIPSEEKA